MKELNELKNKQNNKTIDEDKELKELEKLVEK